MKSFGALLVGTVVLAFGAGAALAEPADVAKTNPLKVFMHYMPWFESPATLGGTNWGYHWKLNNRNPNIIDATGKRQIASHYYPKIGPYASRDADIIEYHLLLMKLSGVDGVMINWYGVQGTNGDIGNLLTSSNALIDKVDDFGLGFSVIMEDRFTANIDQAKTNVAYLRDNYFTKPNYTRLGEGQDPLVGIFGPITFQQPAQWTQILDQNGVPINMDFVTLWYESAEAGAIADGEYAWIYEEENLDNHLTHQANFYRLRSPNIGTAGGAAYPGFNDYYQEGGVGNIIPFEIPHNDGQTLDALLNLANQNASKVDFLQLATFNDFGEGTMFEPTVETGFEYLKKVQAFTGVSYGEEELQLVYRLYLARKRYAGNAQQQASLNEVSELLAALEIAQARTLLDSVAPPGDFNGDGNVDAADHSLWRASFGTQTIVSGNKADGNFDGVVDTADYVVWRKSFGSDASGTNSADASVPEPTTSALMGLAAMTLYCRQVMQRTRGAQP
jgi:hypothetical protein